jgi:ArsR family transcriptional regulator
LTEDEDLQILKKITSTRVSERPGYTYEKVIPSRFPTDCYIRNREYTKSRRGKCKAVLENFVQDKLRRFKSEVFQALAHPTRIAIIELLRDEGEVPVTSVYEWLELEQANVSQHLAILRARHLVIARKSGNQVFYSLRDPLIGRVLDLLRRYFHAHLAESLELLEGLRADDRPQRVGKTAKRKFRAT